LAADLKPLDNPKQTSNVDVNEDVNEDVDVKGKGDCKGKNQNDKKVLGEDPVKLESNKGKNGINDQNGKTDFRNGERRGTENDTANDRTFNERTTNGGTEDGKNRESDAGSIAAGITMPASAEIISSTSANTFKARVEYAKSLGIEERVARMICNFAQSKKYPLAEAHYKAFVGKSEKEAEEAFSVLKLVAQRTQSLKGLKRINTS
jgi:hypothetical protein